MNSPSQTQAYDFTLEEVQKLFQMQDELNAYIHPEWKTQGFNWGLAIVDECMEIHGHLGWKWWKKGYQVGLTEENRKQIQLEVIDILHFCMSSWIEDSIKVEQLTECLNDPDATASLSTNLACMFEAAHFDQSYSIAWKDLAHSVGLIKSQILETYTQKHVLNKFRQDHGYKDGTYQKEWTCQVAGTLVTKEDNGWLEYIVSNPVLLEGYDSYESAIYDNLQHCYDSKA